MSDLIGRTLSFYEFTALLGRGAMGEVYLARDTRLDRRVAVKVLPPEFACEGERVHRFEREARTLASLSHPNVAQVFGIDQVGDIYLIAMELVEGVDLSERLAHGRLPLDEALDVCRQVADGLEAAHEAGAVHRDLKPANVRLAPDGTVKVVDFGLAKSVTTESGGSSGVLTTEDGRLLGTPPYMSPEQARGRHVDRRTDIWALGCLLYECLTGARAVPGESAADVLGAITTGEPDWAALERVAPPRVVALVRRMLVKDARHRMRDIGDARVELEALLAPGATAGANEVTSPRRTSHVVLTGAALVAGLLFGFLVATREPSRAVAREAVLRLSVALEPATVLDSPTGMAPPLALSPDGRQLAFTAFCPDGMRRLHVRDLSDGSTRAFPGTEGAEIPFFAADGARIGFAKDGAGEAHYLTLPEGDVRRIRNNGGYTALRGIDWADDGDLYFGAFDSGICRLDFETGDWVQLTTPEPEEFHHGWPQLLPDGRNLLFTVSTRDGRRGPCVLDLESGAIDVLPLQGSITRYLSPGFLVYSRATELWAVRFDPTSRSIVGKPARFLSDVHESALGNPHFAISTGANVLAYEPIRPPSPGRALLLVDRAGNVESLGSEANYEFPRFSNAGDRILVNHHSTTSIHDIWLIDAVRRTSTPITSGGNFVQGIWMPGDRAIIYTDLSETNMHLQDPIGAEPVRILSRLGLQLPFECTPNNTVLFHERTVSGGNDIFELDLESGAVRPVIATAEQEMGGAISPDGRRIAYVSSETGRFEVYLQTYPETGSKERLTTAGGSEPVWSPSGDELFFRNANSMYSVAVPKDIGESVGEPVELFSGSYVHGFYQRPNYDVSADGQSFVMVEQGLGLTKGRLDLVFGIDQVLAEALGGND